jgi:hypothetical protein
MNSEPGSELSSETDILIWVWKKRTDCFIISCPLIDEIPVKRQFF